MRAISQQCDAFIHLLLKNGVKITSKLQRRFPRIPRFSSRCQRNLLVPVTSQSRRKTKDSSEAPNYNSNNIMDGEGRRSLHPPCFQTDMRTVCEPPSTLLSDKQLQGKRNLKDSHVTLLTLSTPPCFSAPSNTNNI